MAADGRFQLTVEDALALAAAISDEVVTSVTLPSTGKSLPIKTSGNGCRRIDVPDPSGVGARGYPGWMKLMAQNKNKGSATAARARAGASIVHILPLDAGGGHTNGVGWGMVEDGVLTKNSTAAIDQRSFREYKAGGQAAAPAAVAPAAAAAPVAAAAPAAPTGGEGLAGFFKVEPQSSEDDVGPDSEDDEVEVVRVSSQQDRSDAARSTAIDVEEEVPEEELLRRREEEDAREQEEARRRASAAAPSPTEPRASAGAAAGAVATAAPASAAAAAPPGALTVAPYKKSVTVSGDTRPQKDKLKELGGRWNRFLTAWIFPAAKRDEVVAGLRAVGATVTVSDQPAVQPGAPSAAPAEASAAAVPVSADGKVTLSVERYKKALLVKGDTKPAKDTLKRLGGRWNSGLGGWIFGGKPKATTVLLAGLRADPKLVVCLAPGVESGAAAGPAEDAAAASAGPAKRMKIEDGKPKPKGARSAYLFCECSLLALWSDQLFKLSLTGILSRSFAVSPGAGQEAEWGYHPNHGVRIPRSPPSPFPAGF